MMKTVATRLCLAAFAVGLAGGPLQAQEYKIGYITDLSGPLAGSYTPTWQGFELYMKGLNDQGGVNGRKVKISLDDDGLRADRAVAAAKKQVERDEVLGIFGLSLSSTIGPVVGEMRKAGVPVASTFSAILDALPPAKPMYYSTGVAFEVAGEAIGVLSQRIAPKGKVVGVTFDSVGGRAALRHNKLMAEKLGYSWDEIVFPVRTADFMPFAQSAAALKPDIVVGHYGAEHNLGFVTALRAAGYTVPTSLRPTVRRRRPSSRPPSSRAAATISTSSPASHRSPTMYQVQKPSRMRRPSTVSPTSTACMSRVGCSAHSPQRP
jgi:ABC-type branched-subunit amino acid transport system substrate-binding protein